jgi:hypothetical protein
MSWASSSSSIEVSINELSGHRPCGPEAFMSATRTKCPRVRTDCPCGRTVVGTLSRKASKLLNLNADTLPGADLRTVCPDTDFSSGQFCRQAKEERGVNLCGHFVRTHQRNQRTDTSPPFRGECPAVRRLLRDDPEGRCC